MVLWLLLTLAVLAQCGRTPACPRLCSCSPAASGTDVECSQAGLKDFPVEGLPADAARLSVQSTNLSGVAAAHLAGVPLLTDLQLYHSGLDRLPADLLENVPRLVFLDLTGNRLTRLPPGVFNHSLLQNLILKGNLIEDADPGWVSANSSLLYLDLSGNRLSEVPADLLHKLKNLQNLDLSDNDLRVLEPDALKQLRRLVSLNLSGNKLASLQPTTFASNPSLGQLFLQGNQLRELPPELLLGLQELEMLLLNQNQLERLPQGLLDGDRSSEFSALLTQNPWVCDAAMAYLWRWVTANRSKVLFVEEVTCAGPGALKGRQLISLSASELSN